MCVNCVALDVTGEEQKIAHKFLDMLAQRMSDKRNQPVLVDDLRIAVWIDYKGSTTMFLPFSDSDANINTLIAAKDA
jgi:hypothetical protein